jgi:hypothetical protein
MLELAIAVRAIIAGLATSGIVINKRLEATSTAD